MHPSWRGCGIHERCQMTRGEDDRENATRSVQTLPSWLSRVRALLDIGFVSPVSIPLTACVTAPAWLEDTLPRAEAVASAAADQPIHHRFDPAPSVADRFWLNIIGPATIVSVRWRPCHSILLYHSTGHLQPITFSAGSRTYEREHRRWPALR